MKVEWGVSIFIFWENKVQHFVIVLSKLNLKKILQTDSLNIEYNLYAVWYWWYFINVITHADMMSKLDVGQKNSAKKIIKKSCL